MFTCGRTLEDARLNPEKDEQYSLRRLEAFFQEYRRRWDNREVAPVDSQWRRDNQYSYSMFLTTQHNVDIYEQRIGNDGMLKARYEPDDELRDTEVDLRLEINDAVDVSEHASVLNFLPSDTFRDIIEQEPPNLSQINVAFPQQRDWEQLEKMVRIDKTKLFMAQPPPSSVSYDNLTVIQKWAVDLGTDMNHKILYLCGKAGVGKSQVALIICEKLRGRCQAAAATGKGALRQCTACFMGNVR